MEKSRKPKIRFKGFTDDWEQRELGDLGSLKNGMNFSKDAMGHGSAFVNLQNIFGNNVVDAKSLGLAEASEKQLLDYSLQKGDVLFVRSSVKLEGVGETALVAENLENTTYSGFIIRFRDEYGLNNDFKKFVFATKKGRDQIMSQATNSANKNISQSVLENLTLKIPSKDEQKLIGYYLSTLERLITLHQRKLDKLVNVKKSMLEKMFPQQGSRIPEIRFCGFTDDWEQREFSEMFDCTISNNTLSRSELSYEEGSILNIHYGDILIKYGSILDIHKYKIPRIPNKKKEDFKGSLLQPGDVVIADTAEDETSGKACEIGGLFGNSIVAGLHTMVARPNIEMASGYLGYYLNSNAYHCQLLPMMQGIKVQSLSRANVKKTALKFPESTKEQQLIANYFIQLDELITLHQRKLEKLKNIKKSMLEKMFI